MCRIPTEREASGWAPENCGRFLRLCFRRQSREFYPVFILSIGRIVGETAALIYTAGTVTGVAGLMDSGRTLAIHMYVLSNEGLHKNEANATAVVLLVIVL